MIVEVISVGTELLIGQIVNTNAAVIGRALAFEGFDAHFQVTVGDNLERLVDTVERATGRSDAVIVTGGIGPTQDDLTREALATVAGVRLIRDEEHSAHIRRRLLAVRGVVPENNLRQADLPEGSEGLVNANGMALGIVMQHSGTWLFALPGVPSEMSLMLEHQVLPRLRRAAGGVTVLRSRILRTWGMGESHVAEVLDGLFASPNPSIAFLVEDMEVKVRITAKGETEAAVREAIAPVEDDVRRLLGSAVFAVDDERVEALVSSLLADRTWTLATVEEATLGMVGTRFGIFAEPGRYRGTVTMPAAGAPRAEVVLDADVIVSVGPAVTIDGGDAHEIEFTVTTPEGRGRRLMRFVGDMERVRSFATIAALHLARLGVQGTWWEDAGAPEPVSS